MNAPPAHTYQFGDFRLDPAKRLLWRGEAPVPLTPRVFETLLYMVEHHDTVLDKERLMEAIWPDSIVEENNLTQNISTLRRVFGETPGSHRYIVTIPGRGYRFVANVRTGDLEAGLIEKPSLAATPSLIAPDEILRPGGTTSPRRPARITAPGKSALVMIALALLLIAVVTTGFLVSRSRPHPSPTGSTAISLPPVSTIAAKSIAVLPFENLSSEPENAYIAAGIQEEILSNLSKIADLKVISRTSANLYKAGSPRNAQEVGRQLGAAHLLEGSVQRSGERLRVHAQLIDTRTDSHLWAQTYDRNVADVFAIQSEIASTIADQLQARISEREKTAIAQPATSDLIANAFYAQALALDAQFLERENGQKALDLLEQAVARDPRFLLALCELGRIHLAFYLAGFDHTPARLELVNNAIQEAAQIQPDAGEVHLIRARYFAFALRDYARARSELDLARRSLPNNPAVYYQTALIDRRQGNWTEAVRGMEQALELDPRNVQFLINTANTYEAFRRYADAAQLCKRAVAIAPRNHDARILGALQPFYERADVRPLRAELNAILAEEPEAEPKIVQSLLLCALLERDVAAADRALALIPPAGLPGITELVVPREWYVGHIARTFNRPETARTAFAATRVILEKLVSEQPDHASAWSLLGRVEAGLGRKEEAIKAGRRAVELLPVSQEAVSGLRPLRTLTQIYAWAEETDLAIEQLTQIAETRLGVNYGELTLHPDWDSLRGDPRFQKIVASLAPKPDNNGE